MRFPTRIGGGEAPCALPERPTRSRFGVGSKSLWRRFRVASTTLRLAALLRRQATRLRCHGACARRPIPGKPRKAACGCIFLMGYAMPTACFMAIDRPYYPFNLSLPARHLACSRRARCPGCPALGAAAPCPADRPSAPRRWPRRCRRRWPVSGFGHGAVPQDQRHAGHRHFGRHSQRGGLGEEARPVTLVTTMAITSAMTTSAIGRSAACRRSGRRTWGRQRASAARIAAITAR